MARRVRPAVLAALAAIAVAGCVERGDFGRVKPSVWSDAVAATGALAAAARDEPVSPFPFTDDETLLRDRAWRFLVPAGESASFQRALGELVATRILPAAARDEDPRAYLETLEGLDARSPTSRYRRLADDAAADERLVAPFGRVAERVLSADRVRVQTLSHAASVTPADAAAAWARVAENRCVVAWVRAGLRTRVASYRYALEHLVIATPQLDAVPVERTLTMLAGTAATLDRLPVPPLAAAACLGEPEPATRARPAPLVAKG